MASVEPLDPSQVELQLSSLQQQLARVEVAVEYIRREVLEVPAAVTAVLGNGNGASTCRRSASKCSNHSPPRTSFASPAACGDGDALASRESGVSEDAVAPRRGSRRRTTALSLSTTGSSPEFVPIAHAAFHSSRRGAGASRGLRPEARKRWDSLANSPLKGSRCPLPLHPTCWARVLFDGLSIAFLLYDSAMVPLALAWNVEVAGPLRAVAWTTLSFWLADLLLNFCTGFTDKDKLIMQPCAIARHYLQTSFFPDFLVVGCDLVGMVLSELAEGPDTTETLFLRLIRTTKVGRMVRIVAKFRTGLFSRLDQLLVSVASKVGMVNHVGFVVTFLKLIVVVFWLNHMGACAWWIIVQNPSGGVGWFLDVEEHFPGSQGVTGLYAKGLYWAGSTMVGGASFMIPRNSLEAVFTQLYIILSALFLSSFTSSLAAMLIQAQMVKQDEVKKLRNLSTYLEQHKITPLLSMTIHDQISRRMKSQARLSPADVPALALLSARLRSDLRYDLYSQYFIRGQSFCRVARPLDAHLVQELCCSATSDIAAAPGEELFTPGEQMGHAYIALWGGIQYSQSQDLDWDFLVATGNDKTFQEQLHPGQWVCELALWIKWSSVGWLEAVSPSEVLRVSVQDFLTVLGHHPEISRLASSYALKLCDVLRVRPPHMSDLDSGVEWDSIWAALSAVQRMAISRPLLDDLAQAQATGLKRRLFMLPNKGVADLEEEIRLGKSHLVPSEHGAPLRVTQLVVVQLRRADQRICILLAEFSEDLSLTRTMVELPGTKVQSAELPSDSLQRWLDDEFAAFPETVRIGRQKDVVVTTSHSGTYGVETKYIRRTYHASVVEREGSGLNLLAPSPTVASTLSWAELDPFLLETMRGHHALYVWMPWDKFESLQQQGEDGEEEVRQWVAAVAADMGCVKHWRCNHGGWAMTEQPSGQPSEERPEQPPERFIDSL